MIGKHLGPYEIKAPIGKGGMGEVYRATDTRLDRTVAIKVLPEHLASDPQRRERFEREAKAVSSLNHPHICTLFDVGEQGGTHYLVMELVEGETLEATLERGRLPLDKALEYAIQIADALDKAHRQGVVHRDLKPANIMLTKSGVKLLDFGLAKLKGDAGAVSPMSQMPTQDSGLTAEGTILGTLQYMAPEQLEGQDADARTDIFAFGAVVYEMVTGKKAFEGKSQASLIAAIIEREPQPMGEFEEMTPRSLDRLVRQCLAKDPDDRWQTAGDLMREMQWLSHAGSEGPALGTVRTIAPSKRGRIALALAAVIAVVMAVIAFRPEPLVPEARYHIVIPSGSGVPAVSISPDGSKVVSVGPDENGTSLLWIHDQDSGSTEARPLGLTAGAYEMTWSPDSQSLLFQTLDRRRSVIDIESENVRPLPPGSSFDGAAWHPDGFILVPTDSGFETFAASGPGIAEPEPVVVPRAPEYPTFLPDGDHFLYFVASPDPGVRGVYVAQLGETWTRRVLESDTNAVYVSPGYLLFVLQETLYAQEFDLTDMETRGERKLVASSVEAGSGRMAVAASETGAIIYRASSASSPSQFVWRDRNGAVIDQVEVLLSENAGNPELSSDGLSVVFEQGDATGNVDVYRLDFERDGIVTRFTNEPQTVAQPTWSSDDTRIAYFSNRNGPNNIYAAPSNRIGNEEPLVESPTAAFATDWSEDYLLYTLQTDDGYAAWVLDMNGSQDESPVVEGEGSHGGAQFSPDGRWIAWQTESSSGSDIWVKRFPNGESRPVSTNGGTQVRWGPNSDELFYVAPDRILVSVAVQLPVSEGTPRLDLPVPLFLLQGAAGLQDLIIGSQQYDVHPYEDRFLMLERAHTDVPITVILNWNPENE